MAAPFESVLPEARVLSRHACIEHIIGVVGVSERQACLVLGQQRSPQRKIPRGREGEAALTACIVALSTRHARYG